MKRFPGFARLIAATAIAGVLAGLAAVAFHYLADVFGEQLFAWAETNSRPMQLPYIVLVPTVGLFLVGLVLQRVPEARLGGVREVLDALDRHDGKTPLIRLLNVILSGLVLAFGGSVGPEGPMVQMGALAGSLSGQAIRLTGRNLQTIVRAGAAAGIAAAFRSPAGGVLLTLEVFGAKFNRDLAAIAIAAGIGYIVRIAILGDHYPFRPQAAIEHLPLTSLLLVAPLMGLAAAPVSRHRGQYGWFQLNEIALGLTRAVLD